MGPPRFQGCQTEFGLDKMTISSGKLCGKRNES